MSTGQSLFQRTELLLGDAVMKQMMHSRVILFGVGGVGSWCAECLVRSGVGRLTIVDGDYVCETNVNRQLMATTETLGRPKVEVLSERLRAISPSAEIVALQKVYTKETAADFTLNDYDFVIDAIDSVADKCLLILDACRSKATFFSSMGAALKMDPTAIHIAEFWQVKGCPLARTIRHRFKRNATYPSRKFKCIYSEELLSNKEELIEGGRRTNGTLCHITATFGFMLAGLVIQTIQKQTE